MAFASTTQKSPNIEKEQDQKQQGKEEQNVKKKQGAGLVWFTSKTPGTFDMGWMVDPSSHEEHESERIAYDMMRLHLGATVTSVVYVPKNVHDAYLHAVAHFANKYTSVHFQSDGVVKDQCDLNSILSDLIHPVSPTPLV